MPKPAPPIPQKLTPEQFKALAKYKGWTYRAMAARWEIQPESLSAIARNPHRATRYDDMLHGLPNLKRLGRDTVRLSKQIEFAMGRAAQQRVERPVSAKPLPPGYRYHDYLCPGTIVTASCDVGSMAEEGSRGVVFSAKGDGVQQTFGVIFETGLWEWFSPDAVDKYLASTGLTAPEASGYQYLNEQVLQNDFDLGKFQFWPAYD
jgi:hypothetical protein